MRFHVKVYEDGSQWTAEVVEAPGCVTCAKTRTKALAAAREALEGWLLSYIEAGEAPPRAKPRSVRGLEPIDVDAQLGMAVALRWARAESGFTQAELAKRAGMSQQQLAKLEQPAANPSVSTLARLAGALGGRLEVAIVGGGAR